MIEIKMISNDLIAVGNSSEFLFGYFGHIIQSFKNMCVNRSFRLFPLTEQKSVSALDMFHFDEYIMKNYD